MKYLKEWKIKQFEGGFGIGNYPTQLSQSCVASPRFYQVRMKINKGESMKNIKKKYLNPYKSLLVNILYHTGFNKDAIRRIAGISLNSIKKYIVK